MASTSDIFYFGSDQSSNHHSIPHSSVSSSSDSSVSQAGFPYRLSPQTLQPALDPNHLQSTHYQGPDEDAYENSDERDSELEDDQSGGVPIPLSPEVAFVALHTALSQAELVGLESEQPWQIPTSSSSDHQEWVPWSETEVQDSPAPDYILSTQQSPPTSSSSYSASSSSSYSPPETNTFQMSIYPTSMSLGNSQFAVAAMLDDFEINTPSVDDYTWKPDICKFMDQWRMAGEIPQFGVSHVGAEASKVKHWERSQSINREDLQGNRYDVQGINWDKLETTREEAREARTKLYQSTTSRAGPQLSPLARKLPSTESYFSFRRMNTNHQALIAHFQLRNLIAATSRNDIYYAGRSRIMRTDSLGHTADCVMDLTKSSFDSLHSAAFDVTSMTASDDILVAGGFYGEYALIGLRSEFGNKPTQGFITHKPNGITNHVQTFNSRSNGNTMVAFSSNDKRLRILDCHTNTFVSDFGYEEAINCSATSPNGRMRMIVGDFEETVITDADTGRPFERLIAHSDHAFACAWADDGIHLATGAQDSKVAIYDARWWRAPLAVLASSMACPRSLHFSPVGGGRRVLLAAEADDVVSVINAQTFDRCQTLDFFGTVSGAAFVPDGSSFFVANSDGKFGGIMEFERAGYGEQFGVHTQDAPGGYRVWNDSGLEGPHEWASKHDLDADVRVRLTAQARKRRGLDLDELIV